MLTTLNRRAHRALRHQATSRSSIYTAAFMVVLFALGAVSVRSSVADESAPRASLLPSSTTAIATTTSSATALAGAASTSIAMTATAFAGAASTSIATIKYDAQYSAVIVAQLADCNGNLGHFAFLDRRSVKPHIKQRIVLMDGAARDTSAMRSLLPRGLAHAPLHVLTTEQRQLLQQLGHHATPVLALYDAQNRLVLLAPTPTGPVERTTFIRAITRLIRNDPSP